MKHRKSSKQILASNSKLKGLVHKTNYLNTLNQRLLTLLAPPLVDHCTIANVRQNVLIIYVNSAAWGMKLRYQLPELLEKLRGDKTLADISSIEYKIRPANREKVTLKNEKVALKAQHKLILDELKSVLKDNKN